LWLASQVGLVRFNGSSFKLYYPDDEPVMEANIMYLGKNDQGTIYFETDNHNLYRYQGNNNQVLSPVNTSALKAPYLLNGRKQLFDFSLAREFWGKQFLQIEIEETATDHALRERCTKLFRAEHSSGLNFLKDSSAQRIEEVVRVQEPADFQPRAGFHEYRAEQAQSVALHLLAVRRFGNCFCLHVRCAQKNLVPRRADRAS